MNVPAVAAVVLYLVALVAVGLHGRRLATDSGMFNVFGRRAGSARATAGYLSLIGGGELLTLSQFGYETGFGFAWFLGGLVAGFLFLAAFGDRIREEARAVGANTLVSYINYRFGRPAAAAAGLVYVIALGSLLVIQFIVGGELLAITAGISRDVTPVLMGAAIVSYLLAAGYVAVLSTDILRALILFVVLGAGVLIVGSQPSTGWTFASTSFAAFTLWDGACFFILGVFGVVCAADIWQTTIASADKSVLQRSMVGAAAVFLMVGSAIGLLGMVLRFAVPELDPGTSALAGAATNAIWPALGPLVALMVIGAVMATADTEIWVISTSIVGIRHGTPREGEDYELFQSRIKRGTKILLPIVTIAAVALAYGTRDGQGLYASLLVLLTSIAPAMLAMIFGNPSKAAMSLSLWGGIAGFLVIFALYRLAIPPLQSLVPPLLSLIGLLIGQMLQRRA